MKTFKLTLIASSLVLLGACASKPEPAKTAPLPTNVTLDELNTAIDGGDGLEAQREGGDEGGEEDAHGESSCNIRARK